MTIVCKPESVAGPVSQMSLSHPAVKAFLLSFLGAQICYFLCCHAVFDDQVLCFSHHDALAVICVVHDFSKAVVPLRLCDQLPCVLTHVNYSNLNLTTRDSVWSLLGVRIPSSIMVSGCLCSLFGFQVRAFFSFVAAVHVLSCQPTLWLSQISSEHSDPVLPVFIGSLAPSPVSRLDFCSELSASWPSGFLCSSVLGVLWLRWHTEAVSW